MRGAFLLILALSFFRSCAAEHEKHPSAMVVGTVYCDTCFQQQFSNSSHFISGASVEVECGDLRDKNSFHKEVKTDRHGEFKVHLPFAVGKHIRKIKKCSVKLVSSSEPFCAVASMATSSLLHLKSRKQGTHIFSAGFFTFKPLKQPKLCYEKPSPEDSSSSSMKTVLPYPDLPPFPPSEQSPPPILNLPPLPHIPVRVPPIPRLPTLPPALNPGTPVISSNAMQSSHQEPAHHPTFLLDPNQSAIGIPFPPQPIVPPNPLLPPPSFNNPPSIPIITPPEPVLPFPFPTFPGIPPPSKSKETTP